MLAKKFRLSGKVVSRNRQKRTISTPLFIVKISQNELPYNRYGVIVSKKVDKRAVVRNRLKRMLNDACLKINALESGKDILFIVRKDFSYLSLHELGEYLTSLWIKK